MKTNYYITTTIPYVNADPHVGFALELVQADVLARWKRSQGYNVRLQTGSDENSLKNVLAAENAGEPVDVFVSRKAGRFLDLQESLNIQADDFIRTSADERHAPAVHKLWNACLDAGDLYRKSYSGLYCVGCEQFFGEQELVSGCCPEHGTRPELIEETNWFFKLSRYQEELERAIVEDQLRISPDSKRNEVLSLIRSGLEDISISRGAERSRGWGIQVPDDPGQTIYVWFDALGNYLSALGYGDGDPVYQTFWHDAGDREHVVGKGVTRFHAVYWPAILLSAGLPLPTRIRVHGYLTVDGRKIGKSNGNAIDPVPLVETYGADAVRYYLLRHIRASEDGNFSVARLEQAYSSELAAGLGNLVQRLLPLVVKRGRAVKPVLADRDRSLVDGSRAAVRAALEEGEFHIALASFFSLVAHANKAVAVTEPWKLLKEFSSNPTSGKEEEVHEVFGRLLGLLRAIQELALPFIPDAATKIGNWLRDIEHQGCADVRPLFPKLPSNHVAVAC